MILSAPGTEAFKQDFARWDSSGRRRPRRSSSAESSLSEEAAGQAARDRLAAGVDDKPPAEYEQQVDSYFKAIAGHGKPDRNRQAVNPCSLLPLPWWLATLRRGRRSRGLALLSYRRPLVPLTRAQRGALVALRAASLIAVVLFLCRPVLLLPPADGATSSCRCSWTSRAACGSPTPAAGRARRAAAIVRDELLPALSRRFTPELHAVGEAWRPRPRQSAGRCAADRLTAAHRATCASAIAAGASPASSCSRTAATPARIRARRRVVGRRCLRSASARPTACATARSSAWPPAIRGSIRRSVDLHVAAVSTGSAARRSSCACSRTAARCSSRDRGSGRRRIADRRGVHRVARSADPDGVHGRSRPPRRTRPSSRTTRAACW